MNEITNWNRFSIRLIGFFLFFSVALLISGEPVFSHGGKKHAKSFTSLAALKKATRLYDQLVDSGKLAESWESGLKQVKIYTQEKKGAQETVVMFQRSTEDPDKVFFFFDSDGEYAGSNFTGQ